MSIEELEGQIEVEWEKIDENDGIADGILNIDNLQCALQVMEYSLPQHKIRVLVEDLENKGKLVNGGVDKNLFIEICKDLHKNSTASNYKTSSKRETEDFIVSQGAIADDGSKHTISKEEQRSFAQWINGHFAEDPDVSHLLPLSSIDGGDMYEKITDGILLCKLINLAEPDTIDLRAIHRGKKVSLFQKHENLNTAISSAKAIGINVVSIDSHSLIEKRKHLILGLLWQLISSWLFTSLSGITSHPGIGQLFPPPESIVGKSPEEILLRWVNFQLEKADSAVRIRNFGKDIKDSVAYIHLIKQIAPEDAFVDKSALQTEDLLARAERTLVQSDKLGCREFVIAQDIVDGRDLLNLAFVANLFKKYPGLDSDSQEIEIEETREEKTLDNDVEKETREETMFRNWMNSLGLSRKVNWLYLDTNEGSIYFQIFDIIQPGIVDWSRVKKRGEFSSMVARAEMQKLENCNYVVELAKQCDFVTIGLQGSDIREGKKMLVLGLVWQLMRAYTLSLLRKLKPDGTPIAEKDILAWANKKLSDAGKEPIKSFQDSANRSSLPVVHLINSMRSGVIDYSIVYTGSDLTEEECMNNAKYAFTVARRLKAPIYALPEDMAEVKQKMVMTVYASLMLVDMS